MSNRPFLQSLAFLAGLGSVPVALITWAAGSDFVFRGCNALSPAEWVYTANCTDAQNVMWTGGLISAVLLVAALGCVWRLRYV